MYEMIIHVASADDMAVIVQACKGTAQLISSKLLEEQKKRRGLRRRVAPTDVVPTVLRGIDLARKLFADGKHHSNTEVRDVFTAHGFAANSSSPILSKLYVKTGEVKQTTPGHYIATSKLKQVNSGEEHS